jgi:choline dehydrogenase-like flavoprotein
MSRNVTGCPDGTECGYCGYGCRSGAKNDTARTYLRDASKLGARLVPLCEVSRVKVEHGRASGVVAAVTGPDGVRHRLTVHATVVVVASGAIHTPALLSRSGVSNRNIGRGLRLHPSTAVVGVFEEQVDPWTGFMQTRYSDQFADLHNGYGAKFETVPIHFALPSSGFGWGSGEQARRDFQQLSHSSIAGVLLRDRDCGRVTVNRAGQPKVDYELSDYDVGHLRTALKGAARVLAAAGARELSSLHTPPVRVAPNGDGWLDEFISGMDRSGYRGCRMSYVAFHQMASASMGSDPTSSVVGETGESHDVRGLYVADASTFPTSSGVNPMITIMAIADHVARAIHEDW